MSQRASATVHELTQCGLLCDLPGERLGELARRMEREEVPSGAGVVLEGEEGDRFYVILGGLFIVSHQGEVRPRAVLRPGEYFGEVALAMHIPRTASVRALTASTVASCDEATFDEFIRPLFADDV
jgi:ATP-binding cassette, subfamily B, bacterial